MSIHKSVLLKEAIDGLNLKKDSVVVDATLGGGGHSKEIFKKIGIGGTLVAIDADERAVKNFQKYLASKTDNSFSGHAVIIQDNFSNLEKIIGGQGLKSVDAILADLGWSSDQMEDAERGLSFLKDGPLDMRYSLRTTNTLRSTNIRNTNIDLNAERVVNKYSQEKLEKILKEYGEEKFAKNIARKIIIARKIRPLKTTQDLVKIIGSAVPEKYRHGKIHFATRTFQALRIEVNQELDNLKKFIPQAIEILKPGGRLAVITFHSLEDRIVKNIFRENAGGCICSPAKQLQILQEKYISAVEKNSASAKELEKALRTGPKNFSQCVCGRTAKIKILTKKPISPSTGEIAENPRARSAKLRVIEKL
ncbi:MAG: 16S rRNA (cytosine(1402)-N(4))-methyltransferase RsmH [Candidatus Moranbacteria bacterium]|nr:16S rRNA (cytosine(1402)-N(4))-methyltransferase RsmH [Candidatus Moranbacteria bacterium]